MTPAEILLWKHIKSKVLWIRFLRQKPIYVFTEDSGLDRFIIADFYCNEYKLIIELDGSIHHRNDIYELDIYKQEMLESVWYRIIRFDNSEVFNNMSYVLDYIKNSVLCTSPLYKRSPRRGRG